MCRCRQIGRIGQLLVNKGRWGGGRLYSAQYAEEMTRQSFPRWGSNYGFLTWLNRAGVAPSFCCAPRWCRGVYRASKNSFRGFASTMMNGCIDICIDSFIQMCIDTYVGMYMYRIVGGDIGVSVDPSGPDFDCAAPADARVGPIVSAPASALLAYGYQARVLYVEPDSNLVIVSMGQTVGQSLWDGGCDYDEGFTVTLMARAWQSATDAVDIHLRQEYTRNITTHKGAVASAMHNEAGHDQRAEPQLKLRSSSSAQPGAIATGSCFCFCPPGQGFGSCFDLYDGDTTCTGKPEFQTARSHCPAVGIVRQCGLSSNCSALHSASDCTLVKPCDAAFNDPLSTMVCSCRPPVGGGYDVCLYQNGSCASHHEGINPLRAKRTWQY